MKVISRRSSAHSVTVGALKDKDLDRIVVVNRRPLDLQDQDLSNKVLCRHVALVRHVFLQLQVHEKLGVGLAIDEVLSYDVVGPATETFVGDGLHFEGEVEIAQIFEGNWWHPDLVLLSWYFDDRSILISLVQILDAKNLGDFALGIDGKRHWRQALKLNLQETFNDIVFPDRWNLDCHFDLGTFSLPDLEANLLEILEPLIAAHRKDVFVKIVELSIIALGDHAQHEGIGSVVLDDLILEADGDIELLDGAREER